MYALSQLGTRVSKVYRYTLLSYYLDSECAPGFRFSGLCCDRKRTAAAAILLLGFFIVAFPTIAFAGHFSAREVAPVEVARELETEILHQQWSLNKTAPTERVVDSKKLVPEKKPNLETMAPDVFLNDTVAAAAIGFFSR